MPQQHPKIPVELWITLLFGIAVIAVVQLADGEKLNLFRFSGDEAHPKLTAPQADVGNRNIGPAGAT